MPRLEEIRSQLNSLDVGSELFARREIKDLPNILWDDERVRGALQGLYGDGRGLLLATDRRLIFVGRKLLGNRVKVEDFAYDKVSSIQYELKMLSAEVTIFSSGNKAVIERIIPKNHACTFCESVRAILSSVEPTESKAVSSPDESSSAKIERLRGQIYALQTIVVVMFSGQDKGGMDSTTAIAAVDRTIADVVSSSATPFREGFLETATDIRRNLMGASQ